MWLENTDENYRNIPLIISWGIWLARNKGIFQDITTSPSVIAVECASIFSFLPSSDHNKFPTNISIEQINYDIPWAYFDGELDKQMSCVSGMVIHTNLNSSILASVGIGSGTNNYSEFFTLKILLCWLIHLGIGSV